MLDNYQEEFEKEYDRQLDAFIQKHKDNPVDPREMYISQNFTVPVIGYYIKHANRIDRIVSKNPEQGNYICLFYDWIKFPGRLFKHYGFGSKVDDWLTIRAAQPEEIDLINESNRMIKQPFFNWNDIIEYRIRLGISYDDILGMSKEFVLDGLPVDIERAKLSASLPIESAYGNNPITKKKKQFKLKF